MTPLTSTKDGRSADTVKLAERLSAESRVPYGIVLQIVQLAAADLGHCRTEASWRHALARTARAAVQAKRREMQIEHEIAADEPDASVPTPIDGDAWML